MKNIDIIIQFARLWGQKEATVLTARDEDISDALKSYDSEEMTSLLEDWAEEYLVSDTDYVCDFFKGKIEEMV